MARSKHFARNPYAEKLYNGIVKLMKDNSLQDLLDVFELEVNKGGQQ